jgi:hypothetical protein
VQRPAAVRVEVAGSARAADRRRHPGIVPRRLGLARPQVTRHETGAAPIR